MNEYLTILTTGGLLALFVQWAAYFLLASGREYQKRSLYRMTGWLYVVLLAQTLIFIVAMLFFPDAVMEWKPNLVFGVQAFPFITFVVMEILYPNRQVNAWTILRHAGLPLTLMVVYAFTYYSAPTVSVWAFWMTAAWSMIYVCTMVPLAIVRARRYEILVDEIFIDTDGRSLMWMARLCAYSMAALLLYALLAIFDMNYLVTWTYNIFAFFVFMVWGLQIARMSYSREVRIDADENADADGNDVNVNVNVNVNEEPAAPKLLSVQLEEWLMTDYRLCSRDLNREMVARAMGVNHEVLARKLREEKGMTLKQFVTDVRMREAERLLLDSHLSIEDIYYRVGYQERSTFSRAFRERNQCSAGEWRESHQQK